MASLGKETKNNNEKTHQDTKTVHLPPIPGARPMTGDANSLGHVDGKDPWKRNNGRDFNVVMNKSITDSNGH